VVLVQNPVIMKPKGMTGRTVGKYIISTDTAVDLKAEPSWAVIAGPADAGVTTTRLCLLICVALWLSVQCLPSHTHHLSHIRAPILSELALSW
jgi:hypothetical protein